MFITELNVIAKNKHNFTQPTQLFMAFLYCPDEMFRKTQNDRGKEGDPGKSQLDVFTAYFSFDSTGFRLQGRRATLESPSPQTWCWVKTAG